MPQPLVPLAQFSGPSDPAVLRSYLNVIINAFNNLIEIVGPGLRLPTLVSNTALYNVLETDSMIEVDASGAGGAAVIQFNPLTLEFQSFGVVKIDSSANPIQIKQTGVAQPVATLLNKTDSVTVWSDSVNIWVF